LQEPTQCKVVAIAEPRPKTRELFAEAHSVDQTLVFDTWQELLEASADTIKTVGKRLADAVIVAVHDQMHMEVVLAFAEQGYHILCEKPMSTNIEDCIKMEADVKKAGIIFGMGHGTRREAASSLLYTDFICSPSLFAIQCCSHGDRAFWRARRAY
jgi:predicted dehydrogenase